MTYRLNDKPFTAIAEVIGDVNYSHVKTVESTATLREFVAESLAYMPGWMQFLFRVRKYFVLILGVRQTDMPQKKPMAPEALSFTPGEAGSFFTVLAAEEDRYWIGEARDSMIAGCFGVVREPARQGRNRFHVVTTATYLRWTACIYFTVIRPFHHLVIRGMIRHVLKRYPNR